MAHEIAREIPDTLYVLSNAGVKMHINYGNLYFTTTTTTIEALYEKVTHHSTLSTLDTRARWLRWSVVKL